MASVPLEKKKHRKPVPVYVRFPIAGMSGMGATLVVHPLDVAKCRMQLSGEGGAARDHRTFLHALQAVFRREGIRGVYGGITANLLHQSVYTTTRFGVFQTALAEFREGGYDGLFYMAVSGMIGGFMGGSFATPVEVALVRMTSDGRLPEKQRRNYKHVFHALWTINREEGFKGHTVGYKATIMRAMTANVSQMTSYHAAKESLINHGYMQNDTKCHMACSVISGFALAFCTCPMDVLKTRLQFMQAKKPRYSGLTDAMTQTVQKEGITALWKGFFPLYARCAPHTMLLFLFSENLTYLYRKHFEDGPGAQY